MENTLQTLENQNVPGGGDAGETTTIVARTPIVNPASKIVNSDVPLVLRDRKAWVCWCLETKAGRQTKVPYSPETGRHASSTNSATWASLDTALAKQQDYSGIGIMFNDGLVGVDLDHCRDPETGVIEPWATDIVAALRSYTEISPSGTGLHILLFGQLPEGKRRKGKIEVYDTARYFTFTGDTVTDTPLDVEDRQAELEAFHSRSLADVSTSTPTSPPPVIIQSDADLLTIAFNAKNGAKIQQLFDEVGADGNSEGDAALAVLLAFYSGGDVARLERLMRQSSRIRPKWDERRGQNTWIYRECEKAISLCTDFYTPPKQYSPVAAEPGGPVLFDKRDATLHTTDSGLSQRLVRLYGEDLRYIWAQDTWLCWNGTYWEADDGIVHGYAGELPRKMLEAVNGIGDGDERTAALKFVIKAEGERSRRAAVNLARSLPGIPVKLDELDADPWLFNCANGTLNLKTGRLREHRRTDLMTLSSPVNFDDEAVSPAWDDFLDDSTGGDPELLRYLAQIAGYALTGVTREEIFPFVYGPGRSGKSTFLAALHSVLGPYAHMAAFDTFTVGGTSTPGSHRDDIAALAGKRLVVALETKKGAGFDEGMIKSITGGDIINARPAYGKTMNFKPQFKLILAANDRPRVDDMDDALWRRLREVPFPYTVAEDRVDMTLKTRLTDTTVNGPAILAWAVKGCLDWQASEKLITPSCVSTATAEYRAEQDPLAEFFAEYCVMLADAKTPVAGLYSAYTEYAKANGVRRPMNAAVFGKRLGNAGFELARITVNGKQVRARLGIGLQNISQHGE